MDISYVQEKIREKRPNLKDSTLTSYTSSLRGIFKKAFPGKDFDLRLICMEPEKVMASLKELSPHSLKSRLAVLTVASEACQESKDFEKAINIYREGMLVNRDKAQEIDDEGHLTERQEGAYMEWSDILKQVEVLKKGASHLLNSKDTLLPKADLTRLQDYLVAMLYTSQAPRRLMDYTTMKLKNYDNSKDNYIDFKAKKFVFNQYKTAGTYGRQEVAISPALLKVLKRWTQVNDGDYLLRDSRGGEMSSVKLNTLLQKIFNRRGFSVNILRHSYISSQVHPGLKALKELKETAKAMGHSVEEALSYKVQPSKKK
jgi:integrase